MQKFLQFMEYFIYLMVCMINNQIICISSSTVRIFNYYFFQSINIVNALSCVTHIYHLTYDNIYKKVYYYDIIIINYDIYKKKKYFLLCNYDIMAFYKEITFQIIPFTFMKNSSEIYNHWYSCFLCYIREKWNDEINLNDH